MSSIFDRFYKTESAKYPDTREAEFLMAGWPGSVASLPEGKLVQQCQLHPGEWYDPRYEDCVVCVAQHRSDAERWYRTGDRVEGDLDSSKAPKWFDDAVENMFTQGEEE